jgi:hypothetical protein
LKNLPPKELQANQDSKMLSMLTITHSETSDD